MILKAAEDKKRFTTNLYFTSAARKAWKHLLAHVNARREGKVLLPAYIGYTDREGSGVFDPIEETNSLYEFYPVNDQLGFSISEMETMLSRGDIKLLLVIHYFGFCQTDIVKVAALCKKYQVILVEDCAHAFQLGIADEHLGNNGDYSFYSLHKYLATDVGGLLKVNNADDTIPPIPEESKAPFHILEQYIKTDLSAVAERRRKNYERYCQLLQDVTEIDIMYPTLNGEVPHNFPIKVKHGKREDLYFNLMKQGMPTIALYYRLIDKIQKEQFPLSFKIANEILNLPVHQDTSFDDIDLLCAAIKKYFNAL